MIIPAALSQRGAVAHPKMPPQQRNAHRTTQDCVRTDASRVLSSYFPIVLIVHVLGTEFGNVALEDDSAVTAGYARTVDGGFRPPTEIDPRTIVTTAARLETVLFDRRLVVWSSRVIECGHDGRDRAGR